MSKYDGIFDYIDNLSKKNKQRFEKLRETHNIVDSYNLLKQEIEVVKLGNIFKKAFNNPPEMIVAKAMIELGYTSDTLPYNDLKRLIAEPNILKVSNAMRDHERGFRKIT